MLRWILSGLLVAIAAVAIFFFTQYQSEKQKTTQLTEEKLELEEEIQRLDQKILALQSEIERRDVELSEKNRQVEELQAQLQTTKQKLQQAINQGKLTQKQIEEMRFKTEQMSYYLQKYQQQITQLEKENQRLRQERETLRAEVQRKESETQKLLSEKEMLEVKVQAASILKAADFSFYATKSENGREEKGTHFKARKVRFLKVCFSVLENPIAPEAKRTAYLVIKNPEGKTVTNFDSGSGYFTLDGQEEPYSMKVEFPYQRQKIEICGIYPRAENENWIKGQYTLHVYVDGFEIGSSTFSLE
ncbi:MAG: hypothetical protein ACUVRD_00320 [Bacteroidia bacterium]